MTASPFAVPGKLRTMTENATFGKKSHITSVLLVAGVQSPDVSCAGNNGKTPRANGIHRTISVLPMWVKGYAGV
jgi:hypothetical protein